MAGRPDLTTYYGWGFDGHATETVVVELDHDGNGTIDRTVTFVAVDGLVRQRVIVYPNGETSTTEYTYNDDGLLVHESSMNTTLAYNDEGLISQVCHVEDPGMLAYVPDNGCSLFTYDSAGRVIEETYHPTNQIDRIGDPSERHEYSYTLDDEGRVTAIEVISVGEPASRMTRTYDEAGNVVIEHIDSFHTEGIERTVTYLYDGGELLRMETQALGVAMVYNYAAGRLVSATGQNPTEPGAGSSLGTARFTYR